MARGKKSPKTGKERRLAVKAREGRLKNQNNTAESQDQLAKLQELLKKDDDELEALTEAQIDAMILDDDNNDPTSTNNTDAAGQNSTELSNNDAPTGNAPPSGPPSGKSSSERNRKKSKSGSKKAIPSIEQEDAVIKQEDEGSLFHHTESDTNSDFSEEDPDAGSEKGPDAGSEKGPDAGSEKGPNAGSEKGPNAGSSAREKSVFQPEGGKPLRLKVSGSSVRAKTVGWTKRGKDNVHMYLNRYGWKNSPEYRLELDPATRGYQPEIKECINHPQNRHGGKDEDGKLEYGRNDIADIWGIAWASKSDEDPCEEDLKLINPKLAKRLTPTYILVQWKVGPLAFTWETRQSMKDRYRSHANQIIYQHAVMQNKIYKAVLDGEREGKSKSPSVGLEKRALEADVGRSSSPPSQRDTSKTPTTDSDMEDLMLKFKQSFKELSGFNGEFNEMPTQMKIDCMNLWTVQKDTLQAS